MMMVSLAKTRMKTVQLNPLVRNPAFPNPNKGGMKLSSKDKKRRKLGQEGILTENPLFG